MRILIIVRTTLYTSPGGDTTQILMTVKYLRQLGINIDIKYTDEVIDYNSYDLIHFFNIIRPDDIIPHIKNDIPFLISTIFVDYSEYEIANRTGVTRYVFDNLTLGQIEYLKAIARWIFNGDKIKTIRYLFNGHKASIQYISKKASILLPNSHHEYQRLIKYTKVPSPYYKIVNAIDPDIFNNSVEANANYHNHIICVGRIEGRKNQLNLIKALINSKFELTIIGKPSPNHHAYYQECLRLANTGTNVHFVNQIDHEELVKIYKAARVHVLASWFETTGLSSLEAGVMNCNIVVTKKGDTEEYFNDMAYYCDPADINSIYTAVVKAYNEPVNKILSEYIVTNYTWMNAAVQTLQAYSSILKNN
ncbi:glycosyltransferase family 4 protein [Arcticibacter eurypsychrophilus]|uniref:glycosyltransferase family 4 protein n=1 Tax=Arcticibacter eurypsychrophilus TaxID=1434752 RepID=UPI00084D1E09|nr:glycosyltransferase family 4 protein [Arcticibacter eurypsychrophilus]